MTSPNFSAILDKPVTEVERPKPLPVGTYLGIVDGVPRMDVKASTGTEGIEFQLRPVQAQADVDQQALADMGGIGEKKIRHTFWITEDSVYRLDEFLYEHLGIAFGTSRKQAISQAPGKQVYFTVIHAPSKDGKSIYANVGGTAKV